MSQVSSISLVDSQDDILALPPGLECYAYSHGSSLSSSSLTSPSLLPPRSQESSIHSSLSEGSASKSLVSNSASSLTRKRRVHLKKSHAATLQKNFKPSSVASPPATSIVSPASEPTLSPTMPKLNSPIFSQPSVAAQPYFLPKKSSWRRTVDSLSALTSSSSMNSALADEEARYLAEQASASRTLKRQSSAFQRSPSNRTLSFATAIDDVEDESSLLQLLFPNTTPGEYTRGEVLLTVAGDSPRICLKSLPLQNWVELGTHPLAAHASIRDALILSFPLYSNSAKIIDLLRERTVPLPSPAQISRVLAFIERWIDLIPADFALDRLANMQLQETLLSLQLGEQNRALQGNLVVRLINLSNAPSATSERSGSPEPTLPSPRSSHLATFAFSPDQLASHLTLISFNLFKKIQLREFLFSGWSHANGSAPSIEQLIKHFNTVSNWVATLIVQTFDVGERVSIIAKMLLVAQALHNLHNFHGLMAILAGLSSSPVDRLGLTWSRLPRSSKKIFDHLQSLMSMERNHSRYRRALRKLSPKAPCIPYFGVVLSDITFILDGNDSEISGLLNFEKFDMLRKQMLFVHRLQNLPYPHLTPLPHLHERLLELHPLSAPELYSESLMREPRMTPRGPVTSPSPGRAITKSVSELFLTADSSCPNPQAATSPRGRAVTESSDRPLDKRSMPRSQTIQDIGQKEREEK